MFLTRVKLNPKRRKTRALLDNRHIGHALIESCTDGTARTLWRIGEVSRDHVELFMYTQVAPSVHPLVEQCGWPEQMADTVRTAEVTRTLADVKAGDTFRFSVQVSPQKRNGTAVRALTSDADVRKWFSDREKGWGFSTDGNFQLPVLGRENYQKPRGSKISFPSAEVTGVLTVTDADLFRDAVQGGLGRTKHAGFGMMLLAPA